MNNIVRFGAAIAVAAALVVGFGGAASANGHNVEVHVRACGPDAVDLWEDYHDNPVEGYLVKGYYLDEGPGQGECTTDSDGNCYFTADQDNDYAEIDYEPGQYLAVICSSESDDVTFNPASPTYLYWDYDTYPSQPLVVCDAYVYDEDASNGGAELPNTGAGMSEQGANLGLLLAGVVALGGLAVASRRAAVR